MLTPTPFTCTFSVDHCTDYLSEPAASVPYTAFYNVLHVSNNETLKSDHEQPVTSSHGFRCNTKHKSIESFLPRTWCDLSRKQFFAHHSYSQTHHENALTVAFCSRTIAADTVRSATLASSRDLSISIYTYIIKAYQSQQTKTKLSTRKYIHLPSVFLSRFRHPPGTLCEDNS